eukprot:2716945-Rhodomonas_salina.1
MCARSAVVACVRQRFAPEVADARSEAARQAYSGAQMYLHAARGYTVKPNTRTRIPGTKRTEIARLLKSRSVQRSTLALPHTGLKGHINRPSVSPPGAGSVSL